MDDEKTGDKKNIPMDFRVAGSIDTRSPICIWPDMRFPDTPCSLSRRSDSG